jgi:hypothetical protein
MNDHKITSKAYRQAGKQSAVMSYKIRNIIIRQHDKDTFHFIPLFKY